MFLVTVQHASVFRSAVLKLAEATAPTLTSVSELAKFIAEFAFALPYSASAPALRGASGGGVSDTPTVFAASRERTVSVRMSSLRTMLRRDVASTPLGFVSSPSAGLGPRFVPSVAIVDEDDGSVGGAGAATAMPAAVTGRPIVPPPPPPAPVVGGKVLSGRTQTRSSAS